MMKTLILLLLAGGISMCSMLFPDEKLTLPRKEYTGNELRTDGYYYYHDDSGYTLVSFLYRNGTIFLTRAYRYHDLDVIEQQMVSQYEDLRKEKTRWGVFAIADNSIKYEDWVAPDEGGLTICNRSGYIENDTTFHIIKHSFSYNSTTYHVNEVWHFKPFSPKPDSTNRFIQ